MLAAASRRLGIRVVEYYVAELRRIDRHATEIAESVAKKYPAAAAQHRALASRAKDLAILLEGSMADIRIGGPTTS